MFLEKINKSPNVVLNYLLGFFIIALFYVIGQFPLAIALIIKAFASGKSMPTTEAGIMKFFSPNVTLFLMLMIFGFVFNLAGGKTEAYMFFLTRTLQLILHLPIMQVALPANIMAYM